MTISEYTEVFRDPQLAQALVKQIENRRVPRYA